MLDIAGQHAQALDAAGSVAAGTAAGRWYLAAPCAVSYGPVPGSVYSGHRLIDVFIRGWDLAGALPIPPGAAPLARFLALLRRAG